MTSPSFSLSSLSSFITTSPEMFALVAMMSCSKWSKSKRCMPLNASMTPSLFKFGATLFAIFEPFFASSKTIGFKFEVRSFASASEICAIFIAFCKFLLIRAKGLLGRCFLALSSQTAASFVASQTR